MLKRVQRVGDILKRSYNGAAILFCGLNIRGPRGALFVQQSAALKDGLRDARAQIPEARAR